MTPDYILINSREGVAVAKLTSEAHADVPPTYALIAHGMDSFDAVTLVEALRGAA